MRSATLGLFVQVQRPPGHSGGNDGGSDLARKSWKSGCRLQERIIDAPTGVQSIESGDRNADPDRPQGQHAGQMIGKSPWLQSVHVDTDARARRHLDVTLTTAGPNSLAGAVRTKVAA